MTNPIASGSGNRPQLASPAHEQRSIIGDEGADWVPSKSRLAIFMQNMFRCPICRLMQDADASRVSKNLHVVVSGDRLVVTEVDNLHRPGRALGGARVAQHAGRTLFRLLSEPPGGALIPNYVPAEGVAMLNLRNGTAYLHVTGLAAGMTNRHGCIFDAVETK